jgi:CO dehydrogenase/acetyl-CoA synthase gamma subunit (corrinoid Fe-S protein)
MLYEVKLRVEQENSKGELKQVTEHYIVDGCEFFAEAEVKAMEEYNNDCEVFSIIQSRIREIVNEKEESKPFFKATITETFVNDDGSEKENKYPVLVCASDIKEANKLMEEYLKQGLSDMRLDGIVKTKILDVL